MLSFFRRFQKSFLIVIAFVVITSFIFFGTFSTFNMGPDRVDRVIGTAIDGSELKLSEIATLSHFIAVDQDDILSANRNTPPNLLNDGVIRKDILKAGLAQILVHGQYEALKSDIESRIQRVKTYRSYEHPETPFLSAKAVWQRFMPEINKTWSFVQSESEVSEASFAQLNQLYQLQSSLPAEWLRQILLMQEQQYKWLKPDPRLRQGDMAMFGFHSLTDWFGKNFVDLTAQFIHNAAITAEEKGYKVTLEEAKVDLQRNFSEAVRKLQSANIPIELTYKDQLRILGVDETEAAKVWKKVLLFRRYFADLGNSVFLDRMAHSEFASVANETAVIDLYQWPSILSFNNAYNLYAFQTYLQSVAALDPKDNLALPESFLAAEEIAKKTPQLVAIDYQAKVFAVDKREIALKAPIQEVWTFETQEETWAKLKAAFPDKLGKAVKDTAERFAVLEGLESETRAKIDSFARLLLVDQHNEWVQEALDHAKGEEKKLFLCAGKIELPYLDNPEKLGTLFAQIPTSPETSLAELSQFATKSAFFRFENIEKLSDSRIKTFLEAMNDRSLLSLVDKKLEAEFPKIRSTLSEDKKNQEFAQVKEEVADALLGDLKKQLQKAETENDGSLLTRRMGLLASRALKDLQQNPNDSKWLGSEGEDPLIAQFKMQRTEQRISRTAKEDWMSKESFFLPPEHWSPIHVAEDGSVMFMYVKTKEVNSEPILEQLVAEKQILASDVQKVLAEKILTAMNKKQAVILPLQPEQE